MMLQDKATCNQSEDSSKFSYEIDFAMVVAIDTSTGVTYTSLIRS